MMKFEGMKVEEVVVALEEMAVDFELTDEGDGCGHFEFEVEGQLVGVYFTDGVVDEVDCESADMDWDE